MRICHVTSAHPEEDGRIFRRACLSSVKAGYETYLVQRGISYEKGGVKIRGIGIPRNPGRLYRMTRFARKAYLIAQSIDADLYHLHDPELLPYVKRFKKAGKAVVFDSHENYVEQIKQKKYLPKPVVIILSKWFESYTKRVYKWLDGLTYPGNDSYLSAYKEVCNKVVTTDNLPWLYELYDQYDENEEKEERTACYIGGLSEARGITQVVKACYLAGCKLYLAGDYSTSEYRRVLESTEEYSCVEYLGTIGRNEIVQLLQRVTIGLCTLLDVGQYYKMKNLPTKVYEYMSMALPVVMNDSPYNIAINNELQIGHCVDAMNVEEIAKAIEDLLDNPEKRYRFGNNGRKAIKTRYCWDKEQNKLIALYDEILKSH